MTRRFSDEAGSPPNIGKPMRSALLQYKLVFTGLKFAVSSGLNPESFHPGSAILHHIAIKPFLCGQQRTISANPSPAWTAESGTWGPNCVDREKRCLGIRPYMDSRKRCSRFRPAWTGASVRRRCNWAYRPGVSLREPTLVGELAERPVLKIGARSTYRILHKLCIGNRGGGYRT